MAPQRGGAHESGGGAVVALTQFYDNKVSVDNRMPSVSSAVAPTGSLPAVLSNAGSAEEKQEIGEYFARFESYDLRISVSISDDPATFLGAWVINLYARNRRFDLTVQGATLVDALRQADMAAGGWYAQLKIEESLKSAPVEKKEITAEDIRKLVAKMDQQNIPDQDRMLVMPPEIARSFSVLGDGMLYGVPVKVRETAPHTLVTLRDGCGNLSKPVSLQPAEAWL